MYMSDFEKYLSALKNLSDLIKTVDYSVEDINNFMEEVGEGYTETNKEEFNDKLNIQFAIGKGITEKTELDKWLTERYALFQDTEKSINEFEIHHLEWPINEVNLRNLEFNYPRFGKLIKNEPNKIQYSNGVKVIAWGKCKKEKTGYK